MPQNKPRKVNIHSHVLLEETMGRAEQYGPEVIEEADGSTTLRVGPYRSRSRPGDSFLKDPRFWEVGARIEDMDKKGIDIMGVTISPLFYLYWAEPRIGVSFACLQNDALSRFCGQSPERLFFIPTLPLQDIEASRQEIDRTFELGAKGLNLGTENLAGRNLDDQALWPLFARAEQLELPLFLHPYPAVMDTSGGAASVDRYNLSWITGYVCQESVAFASLVFGGVLDEFPGLKVCLPHGGGMVPYQFGRLEYAVGTMPDIRCRKPLRDYLANFYFDILVHDKLARHFLTQFMGVDRLLVGDNYMGWDHVDGFALVDELDIPESDKNKIRGSNAVSLFKLV